MNTLPFEIGNVGAPPVKCQGIKTKLVPFIFQNIRWDGNAGGRWVEPFLGSGVMVFNLAPLRAVLADTNRHIIDLYKSIFEGRVTAEELRQWLTQEGRKLKVEGEKHYYRVRDRFNVEESPFDFLFLSRSCFNGLMRFNSGGRFNVPFCRKPARFSPAYITKIVNQVGWVAKQMRGKKWEFLASDWNATLSLVESRDFVYLDPPYIGRHTDYFNGWDAEDADRLADVVHSLPCGYALSMWYENKYRTNRHVAEKWSRNVIRLHHHFYHVGSLESLRNEMLEALIIRPEFAEPAKASQSQNQTMAGVQLVLTGAAQAQPELTVPPSPLPKS